MVGARLVRGALIALVLAGATTLLASGASAVAAETKAVTCATLETAVAKAGTGDVLQLPAGECKLNLSVTNVRPFTIEGAGAGLTVLKPEKADHAIIESLSAVTFTLARVELTGATERPAIQLEGEAGGAPAPAFREDTFDNDSATSPAAALYINQDGPTTTTTLIADSKFTHDGSTTTDFSGGGLHFNGPGPVTLRGNTFAADESGFAGGGAYLVDFEPESSEPVVVDGNTFGGPSAADGNIALEWGGGLSVSVATGQPVVLSRNVFEHNRITGKETAFGDREGAGLLLAELYAHLPFPVTQHDNTFVDNVIDETVKPALKRPPAAAGAGEWIRGLAVQSTHDTFIGNRVAVSDGQPPEGGALGAIAVAQAGESPEAPATLNAVDDLFMGNSVAAGGWGGAIYVGGPAGDCEGACPASSVTLDGATIIGNSVDAGIGSEGGAIWGSPNDSLTIQSTVVAGNTPAPQVFGFGSGSTSFAFSDVCSEAGGPIVPAAAGNICADPQLQPGGQETASSPTIDAGSNSLLPTGLVSDLAGSPRIVDSRQGCGGPLPAVVDMGAFEYQQQLAVPPCAPPPGGPASVKPVLASVSQSHPSWRVGARLASIARRRAPVGTTFSFSLNEPAAVTLVFAQTLPGRRVHGRCVAPKRSNRHRHACRRSVSRGALTLSANSGADAISFQGRLSSSRKLAPGSYSVAISATDAGGRRSSTTRLSFRIVP